MEIVRTKTEIRRLLSRPRQARQIVGLVPTMGALHEGHVSLIQCGRAETDFLVVSIFVNPTQFGPSEDLDKYPRQEKQDLALCEKAGVDVVFLPSVRQMYPPNHRTVVKVEGLSEKLCGINRPTHFAGVTTVVSKLFNIVQPDVAYFGQKDAQQGLIIRRMVEDLDMPVDVRICPTVREEDGLAASSRNSFLGPRQRRQAACLYKALLKGQDLLEAGQRDNAAVTGAMEQIIRQAGPCSIDYIQAVDPETLEPADKSNSVWLLVLAVRIGPTRLIDNMLVEIPRGS